MLYAMRRNLTTMCLIWLGFAGAITGCRDASSAKNRAQDKPAAAASVRTTPQPMQPSVVPPQPKIPAQLFVDTSGSMAGFFGAGRTPDSAGTTLVAVHEEIDAALSESGLSTARKCTVGDAVKCDGVPTAPAKLASAALYHEVTSRLDKVLARAAPPARIDPNNPPVPDALDNARITLLVTDGMEVAPDAGNAASCASGADPTCVRMLLQQRIAEGFGVWLVGVLLPFNGTHFPERTLTGAYFEQARAHVDQLRFDPRNLGVGFAIDGKLGTDPTSGGKSTYAYRGYKALLIFVFSRDPARARSFVATLVKKLRAAPIRPGKMQPQDAVETVEIAPLSATTAHVSRVELVPQKAQQAIFGEGFDPARLAELKLQASAVFDGGLSQQVWCGANGRSMMYVHYDQAHDGVLPSYFKERVMLGAPADAPPRAVAPPSTTGDGTILTGVDCAPLHAGPNTELSFTLATQLSLDPAELEQQWWSHARWSSEDAWQMPERVYRLEDIVLPILRARAAQPAVWNQLVMHVSRD